MARSAGRVAEGGDASLLGMPSEPRNKVRFPAEGKALVTVRPPTGQGVHGRSWRVYPASHTGLTPTTAPTWVRAYEKAQLFLAQIASGAGSKPQVTLRDAGETWRLSHPVHKSRGPKAPARSTRSWTPKYAKAQKEMLDVLYRHLGSRECGHLKFDDLERVLAARPTYNQELAMTVMLTTFTKWLQAKGYALPVQGLHVRMSGYQLTHPWPGGRLGGAQGEREAGEDRLHIGVEDIPSHEAIYAAAKAMPCRNRWGRMMWELELLVNVAAYTATRLGEVLALTCDDVLEAGAILRVCKQTDESSPGPAVFVPTKGNNCRTVPVLEVTPMGYELWGELERRAQEARLERLAGTNPHGLLFPCTNMSSPWQRSNIRNRHFYRAVGPEGANWPRVQVRDVERFVWTFHTLRHAGATYLLREVHTDAGRAVQPDEATLVTGHDDVNTLLRFYIEQTSQSRANIVEALTDTATRTRARLAVPRSA